MRILIDECIDERLRNHLPGHECRTVRYAGLAGLKNGELLNAAERAKFDIRVTVDQGIEYLSAEPSRSSHRNPYFSCKIKSPRRFISSPSGRPATNRNYPAGRDRKNRELTPKQNLLRVMRRKGRRFRAVVIVGPKGPTPKHLRAELHRFPNWNAWQRIPAAGYYCGAAVVC